MAATGRVMAVPLRADSLSPSEASISTYPARPGAPPGRIGIGTLPSPAQTGPAPWRRTRAINLSPTSPTEQPYPCPPGLLLYTGTRQRPTRPFKLRAL